MLLKARIRVFLVKSRSSSDTQQLQQQQQQQRSVDAFVTLQMLINGVWMLLSPARAIHHYPTREDNLLVCSSYIDASYMIAFTYPILLIVVCTIYAVLTRKIPEAFNESKHIGESLFHNVYTLFQYCKNVHCLVFVYLKKK